MLKRKDECSSLWMNAHHSGSRFITTQIQQGFRSYAHFCEILMIFKKGITAFLKLSNLFFQTSFSKDFVDEEKSDNRDKLRFIKLSYETKNNAKYINHPDPFLGGGYRASNSASSGSQFTQASGSSDFRLGAVGRERSRGQGLP